MAETGVQYENRRESITSLVVRAAMRHFGGLCGLHLYLS